MGKAAVVRGRVVNYWDREAVLVALEEAGRTLRALDGGGLGPAGYGGSSLPRPVRNWWEVYGMAPAACRPAVPAPGAIAAMDRVLGWLAGWPEPLGRRVLWGIVLGHSLREDGSRLGLSHEMVRRRRGQAVEALVRALNR